ncbi:glycoside hydrolase family 108 protein [Croceicoccus sp. Ery15]|uniref:glycoside hydrolase family 108 protein n=1 Tax=Croceicoccus sp. Ery15 TaxID=1703338 RepID=UPI001E4DF7DC|nr:glycosyl hydrolase 108 family protein [Croceicoccus sp. Ery15]
MAEKSNSNGGKVAAGGAIGIILSALLAVEGGYVNNPLDPGGATNHGITEAVARKCGYRGDMKVLPVQFAADCYVREYIDKPGFRAIVELDPYLGEEMVDSGANAGPARTSRWFQESLNHYNRNGKIYRDIAEDGKIGAGTMAAFYALRESRGKQKACELLIKATDAKQAQHYMRLSAARPQQFEEFTTGWMDHRVGNVPVSKCGNLK